MNKEKNNLTYARILQYGFVQKDFFFEKNGFRIGFLFWDSGDLQGIGDQIEPDMVDIYHKTTVIQNLPLLYAEDLEFLYQLITGHKIKST